MRLRIRASLHTSRGIRNLFEKKKVDHDKGSEKKTVRNLYPLLAAVR